MVRVRLPLKLIEDEKRRRSTFSKRIMGVKKKAMQLRTLCDVPTFVICYGPNGDVHAWPEDPRELSGAVSHFQGVGAADRDRYNLDMGKYLEQQLNKARAEVHRMKARAVAPEAPWPADVAKLVDARLAAIDERIGRFKGEEWIKWNEWHPLVNLQHQQCSMGNTCVAMTSTGLMGEEVVGRCLDASQNHMYSFLDVPQPEVLMNVVPLARAMPPPDHGMMAWGDTGMMAAVGGCSSSTTSSNSGNCCNGFSF